MSYLTTIVHPLIIIRMLQHRLFGPFSRRTNMHPTRATTAASSTTCASNSLSIGTGHIQSSNPNKNNLQTSNINIMQNKSPSSNSIFITSTSFPNATTEHSNLISSVSANTSKSSSPNPSHIRPAVSGDEEYSNVHMNSNDTNRKASQISNSLQINNVDISNSGIFIDINDNHKLTVSTSNNSTVTSQQSSPAGTSNSKRSKLKDFSKKILRRVNSSSQSKKNRERKNGDDSKNNSKLDKTIQADNLNNTEKEYGRFFYDLLLNILNYLKGIIFNQSHSI